MTLDPSWGFVSSDPLQTNGPNGFSYSLPPGNELRRLNQTSLYDDYEVCAEFSTRQPGGVVDILFWGINAGVASFDQANYYDLTVTPTSGNFAILRAQRGRWLTPITGTAGPMIMREPGAVNRLSVVVKGKHAIVTINGQKAVEFDGQPPEGASLPGFAFSTPQELTEPVTTTVSNFEVRAAQ